MSKKIIFTIIFLLPILYIFFVGYPIVSKTEYITRQKINENLNVSQRCYTVDNINGYLQCLSTKQKLGGVSLIRIIENEVSDMNRVYGVLIIPVFVLQIILLIGCISQSPKPPASRHAK